MVTMDSLGLLKDEMVEEVVVTTVGKTVVCLTFVVKENYKPIINNVSVYDSIRADEKFSSIGGGIQLKLGLPYEEILTPWTVAMLSSMETRSIKVFFISPTFIQLASMIVSEEKPLRYNRLSEFLDEVVTLCAKARSSNPNILDSGVVPRYNDLCRALFSAVMESRVVILPYALDITENVYLLITGLKSQGIGLLVCDSNHLFEKTDNMDCEAFYEVDLNNLIIDKYKGYNLEEAILGDYILERVTQSGATLFANSLEFSNNPIFTADGILDIESYLPIPWVFANAKTLDSARYYESVYGDFEDRSNTPLVYADKESNKEYENYVPNGHTLWYIGKFERLEQVLHLLKDIEYCTMYYTDDGYYAQVHCDESAEAKLKLRLQDYYVYLANRTLVYVQVYGKQIGKAGESARILYDTLIGGRD